jgi:hypothetical protein
MEASGWLDEIEFPSTKQELIEAADEAGEPQETIERLQALAQEQYETREELDEELG